jgi:hypothetical protein
LVLIESEPKLRLLFDAFFLMRTGIHFARKRCCGERARQSVRLQPVGEIRLIAASPRRLDMMLNDHAIPEKYAFGAMI